MVLGLPVLVLAGCASAQPRTFAYPSLGFSVVQGSLGQVMAACEGSDHWDDGSPRKPGEQMADCWRADTREAWVARDHPSAIVHVLCHVAGIEARRCHEEYQW